MSASTQTRSLWRNRDFLFLWWGQTLSSIGTAVSDLAYPLLITSKCADEWFTRALHTSTIFFSQQLQHLKLYQRV
jgi:hypothetical protein